MSKSNAFETAILGLFFNATPIADLAADDQSSPATNLYASLHTADPAEGGNQSSNECAYTGYARVAVARTSGGWTVSGNSTVPAAAINFPACTAGTETATHFGVGPTISGASVLMYKGTVTPNISISNGVTPQLTTATSITED